MTDDDPVLLVMVIDGVQQVFNSTRGTSTEIIQSWYDLARDNRRVSRKRDSIAMKTPDGKYFNWCVRVKDIGAMCVVEKPVVEGEEWKDK